MTVISNLSQPTMAQRFMGGGLSFWNKFSSSQPHPGMTLCDRGGPHPRPTRGHSKPIRINGLATCAHPRTGCVPTLHVVMSRKFATVRKNYIESYGMVNALALGIAFVHRPMRAGRIADTSINPAWE